MAILKFAFDESYNERAMCIGGWLANELEWKKLEIHWKNRIERTNQENAAKQRITRFHASHLNALDHEFENWDSTMSVRFSQRLMSILQQRKIQAVCMATDMEALLKAFPEGEVKQKWSRAYAMCIKQIMVEIGHIMQESYPSDQVLLVHDSGDWDDEALHAFKWMKEDERWESRKYFTTIVPATWKECIGLQPAT